ncbi:hypothetical protein OTU49_003172 [Cherax quadricarinatus]|uniref:Secreted protein n=1 Tax=Cherax quadricarinatus TaxID=27406 RepID=A0AAW0X5N6_CHEQU
MFRYKLVVVVLLCLAGVWGQQETTTADGVVPLGDDAYPSLFLQDVTPDLDPSTICKVNLLSPTGEAKEPFNLNRHEIDRMVESGYYTLVEDGRAGGIKVCCGDRKFWLLVSSDPANYRPTRALVAEDASSQLFFWKKKQQEKVERKMHRLMAIRYGLPARY